MPPQFGSGGGGPSPRKDRAVTVKIVLRQGEAGRDNDGRNHHRQDMAQNQPQLADADAACRFHVIPLLHAEHRAAHDPRHGRRVHDGDCEDKVRHRRSQGRHHRNRQQENRERENHIEDAHDDLVHHAAEITGEKAENQSGGKGEKDGR